MYFTKVYYEAGAILSDFVLVEASTSTRSFFNLVD